MIRLRITNYIKVMLLITLVLIGCHKDGDINTPRPDEPKESYVRVEGNKLIGVDNNVLFLKIASWENPFEGSVSGPAILRFLDYMKSNRLNCILFKGNMWLVNDNRTKNQRNVDIMHWLIKESEKRGIYVILNLFDVWSRGKGTNKYNTNPATHPINVWDWNHRGHAAEYIKWVTREFKRHPMVIFELGNEMERNAGGKMFAQIAKIHLLPHFYNIAGRDRPIGVSQFPMWSIPVNVKFSHDPSRMSLIKKGNCPTVTNELAFDTDLWKDSTIRNPDRSKEYYQAFELAKFKNHSGVAAATIININKPINGSANVVLRRLGRM
jgi:hypothetical protein